MYLYISNSILISKSCGGGCRKLVKCERLLWENRMHMAMYISERLLYRRLLATWALFCLIIN